RVGGSSTIQTNVRVLASTNRDPATAIKSGKLREDLFFRLAVFPIHLPPLRDREGDVSLISQHFLDGHNRTHGTDKHWAPGALDALSREEWRGNVRELRNAVQRAFILADEQLRSEDATARPSGAPAAHGSSGSFTVQVGSSITDVERTLIRATLEQLNGDKPRAAHILGISLKTLYNRLSVEQAVEKVP
ncbi:MAG TPA: helix-turn-helix domain-containing protein, partial [Planctomycetota bacterium]|nr:helix-turn-helix domain-containing protein [Planctomycetota bacterium]